MKNVFIFLMLVCIPAFYTAQTHVHLNNVKFISEITSNNTDRFSFENSFDKIQLSEGKTKDGIYTKIEVQGYITNNDIGNPDLPVMTKLIEVPLNYNDIVINTYVKSTQVIDLNEYGFYNPVLPAQPSVMKDQDPETLPFKKNSNIYADKEYYENDLVKVEKLGKMRGIQIAQLIVSPFSYDIESNTLTIRNGIEVEIIFRGADILKTEQVKQDKYSPAFDNVYKKLWNYKTLQTKNLAVQHPVKYVIVSNRMFEETLQPFIEWKTKKGFNVVTAYTDEIGTTVSGIKSYMQGLYDAGTAEDPAPSYLLIVGDIAQVPATQISRSSSERHPTDMYYCEFDGGNDYIPEMFFGRFSATNVAQLQSQIDKTLMYEQYTFPEPGFLENTVLVAGNDSYWAPTHANGQMNYFNANYLNDDHDVNVNKYLHPNSSSQRSAILANINSGAAIVNYTAHCNEDGWGGPNFLVSDVPNLTNTDKYFFSIGNCCLSNKFDESVCFGEALLRENKKGAVIHIGGSNNTIWNEDFYWSVGIASSITANPTYAGTTQAVYDHLFHENGEEPYITAGQMNYIGNMSVMAATSSYKQYYFEIYHVMGDPSLMAYVGVPGELNAEYSSVLYLGMTTLSVETEADAYVAISLNGVLLDAKHAGTTGLVELEFPALTSTDPLDIVITKQFRIPHTEQVTVIPNDIDYDVALNSIVSPQRNMHVSEANFAPSVVIMNLGQEVLTSALVGYSLNGGEPVEITWTGSLETMQTAIVNFPEITLEAGNYTFRAFVDAPNEETDGFTQNNEKETSVLVYSGSVSVTSVISPEDDICSQTGFIPEITVRNLDSYPLTSLVCSYQCGNVSDEFTWTGNIGAGQSYNIQFNENEFPSGINTIVFSISEPNGGLNKNNDEITISKDYYLVRTGQTVRLLLKTDNYPEETSWKLIDNETSHVLFSYDSYTATRTEHTHDWCLGPGCYTFTVYDSAGDGMSYYGVTGNIAISNTDTGEQILTLNGNGFSSSYSKSFCIEGIECPLNMSVYINDEVFELSGASPDGGVYSGTGVTNGYFDPSIAGLGTHEITYTSNDDETCSFNITVANRVGLGEHDFTNIEVYPNPTNNVLNILAPQNSNIGLINIIGQTVCNINSGKDIVRINMADYPDGTYFVRIVNNEQIVTKKVLVRK
ncbi:MAG: C25 family cysteine peptidase [Bacteroidales bacterium]|jgi:hypothetical protein|nr:C25 family cysteine peptidase [Bacteroidales bacterium]